MNKTGTCEIEDLTGDRTCDNTAEWLVTLSNGRIGKRVCGEHLTAAVENKIDYAMWCGTYAPRVTVEPIRGR